MGGCAGGLLNSLDGGIASLYSSLNVPNGDTGAEAYGLFQIHIRHLLFAEAALQETSQSTAMSALSNRRFGRYTMPTKKGQNTAP
jgi:hypothetical protein